MKKSDGKPADADGAAVPTAPSPDYWPAVPYESWTTSMELARVPTPSLREELARGLTMTANGLTRMGVVWQELERRGEDLSDLRQGVALYLPLIAAGQLAAEAVVAFASRRSVLRALAGVPLPEQRRLAAGGTLAVIDADSVTETPLASLPSSALPLVFDGGQVRTPQMQRIAMQTRTTRKRTGDGPRRYRPRYDPEAGTVTVGRMAIRVADLLSELAAASGPDHPPPADVPDDYATAKTRLTHEEYERFQTACRRAGLPDWEMIRKALRAFGLI